MDWYFAYGSNMNPARMQARGLSVSEVLPGRLPGYGLCFDKRAADRAPGRAYANIRYQRDGVVEGVLYRLQGADEIAKLDHFEGTPVYYSRERMPAYRPPGCISPTRRFVRPTCYPVPTTWRTCWRGVNGCPRPIGTRWRRIPATRIKR